MIIVNFPFCSNFGPDNSGEDSDEDRMDGDDMDRMSMMDDDMGASGSEVTIGPDGKKKR